MNRIYMLNLGLQNENPQSHEESVEALMIALRKMCELKQREHSHISDPGKGSQKTDVSKLVNANKLCRK